MPTQNNCCESSESNEDSRHGLPLKVEESIKNIVSKEGYIEYNVVTNDIITNGGNYLGVLHEVDITGKTADGEKVTNIFVKRVIPGESQLKFLTFDDVYTKELFAYTEISRMFSKIQEEANIPLEERYYFVKCYDGSDSQAILLENLAKKGYVSYQRLDVLPYKFASLAVIELAKLHAISFAIKDRYPNYYEEYIKPMKAPVKPCDDWKKFQHNMYNQTIQFLECDDKPKVGNEIKALLDKYFEYFDNPDTKYCLCHGDFRPNNIMSKTKDGETSKVIPIDYQVMHCGNPVLDFIYFIYGSTDRRFRKDHLEDLKNLYFERFTSFLQYFDLDVEDIYPRKLFEKNYSQTVDFAIIIAAILLPFLLTSDEVVPDISKVDSAKFSFELDTTFKDRYQGIIDEFIEMGYL